MSRKTFTTPKSTRTFPQRIASQGRGPRKETGRRDAETISVNRGNMKWLPRDSGSGVEGQTGIVPRWRTNSVVDSLLAADCGQPQSVSPKPVERKLPFDQLRHAGTSGLPFRRLNLQSFQSRASRTHVSPFPALLRAAGESRYPSECHILAAALLSSGQRPVNIELPRRCLFIGLKTAGLSPPPCKTVGRLHSTDRSR